MAKPRHPAKRAGTVELKSALKNVRSELESAQRQLEDVNTTLRAIQNGTIDAVVAVDRDTGALRVLNLKDSEHPYRVFVEAVAEGALTVNRDGVAIFCNLVFAAMLKQSPGKVLGRSILEFFAPSEAATAEHILAVGAKERIQQEITMQASDGTRLQVQLSVAPVKTEELEGICILATDLSEKHRTDAALRRALERARLVEELSRALELRDEFLSIASHELKTPITSLLLQLQVTRKTLSSGRDTDLEKRHARAVDIGIRQARRLIALIEDLLDVSQIRAGKLQLHPEETDLKELVEGVLEVMHEDCERVGCTCDFEEGVTGYWDPVRLEQVLTNILLNAIKYGDGKPIEVRLGREGSRAVFSVRDRGGGIPEGAHSRIFGQFERAVPASKISGFGLGLFIAKQIVESHGGEIRVESQPGKGALFVVELPLRPAARGSNAA